MSPIHQTKKTRSGCAPDSVTHATHRPGYGAARVCTPVQWLPFPRVPQCGLSPRNLVGENSNFVGKYASVILERA
eukprot:m.155227 g.155227  ORF g.155227 m.155227 type:complete len:75 (-) comp23552_c0_seq1:1367-1591(-)